MSTLPDAAPAEPPPVLSAAFGHGPAFWALGVLLMLMGTASVTGMGMSEPALYFTPVVLGLAAVVSPRPMLWILGAVAVAGAALLVSRSPDWSEQGAPTLLAQWWMVAGTQVLALVGGHALGRVVDRRWRRAVRPDVGAQGGTPPLLDIPLGLIIHREGVVLQVNPAGARLLGFERTAEAVGLSLAERGLDHEHWTSGSRLEVTVPGGSSTPVWLQEQWVRHQGMPARLLTLRDESALAGAEAALRASRSTLTALIDGNPCAMVLTDLETSRILLANDALARAMGRPQDAIRGVTARSLGLWGEPRQRDRMIEKLRAGAQYADEPLVFRAPDGTVQHALARFSKVHIEGRPALLTVAFDATAERRRSLELQAAFDAAQQPMVLVRKGKVALVNAPLARLLGQAPSDLLGRSAARVLGGREPIAELDEARMAYIEGFDAPLERVKVLKAADGQPLNVLLRGRRLDSTASAADLSLWVVEALGGESVPTPPARSLSGERPVRAGDGDAAPVPVT